MNIEEITISTRIVSEDNEDKEEANINKAVLGFESSPMGQIVLKERFMLVDSELDDDRGIPGVNGTVQLRLTYRKEG